jgi:D-alanine--poly(phosphoribitol) ligase subunit 1
MAFLHFGASIILNDLDVAANQLNLIERIKKYQGSIWVSTPSFAYKFLGINEFDSQTLPALRTFLFCGETLPARTAKLLLEKFPSSKVFNSYGPTEATVATTLVSIDADILNKYNPLPVGFPKYTSSILIDKKDNVDEKDGEIIITGEHVSIGYFKMEELNKDKFIIHLGQRGFKTGDFGYFEDGMLFYNGRKDEQVKLHGFRIELGDINVQILKSELVAEVATIPLRRGGEVKKIISFVIAKSTTPKKDLTESIIQFLTANLPNYMIPAEIIVMEKFPYSSNHKIDKLQLIDLYSKGELS